MGLISKEKLMEKMGISAECESCGYWTHEFVPEFCLLGENFKLGICEAIKKAEEVDAVPVVRCRDCKHFEEHKGYGNLGESAYTCQHNMDGWIYPTDYCSNGVRKDV